MTLFRWCFGRPRADEDIERPERQDTQSSGLSACDNPSAPRGELRHPTTTSYRQLKQVVNEMRGLLKVTFASVAGFSRTCKSYTYLAAAGDLSPSLSSMLSVGHPHTAESCSSTAVWQALSSQALLLGTRAPDQQKALPSDWAAVAKADDSNLASFAALPLVHHSQVVGVLILGDKRQHAFDSPGFQQHLERLGSSLAYLFEDGVLLSLCNALEAISTAHSVGNLMRVVAYALLSNPDRECQARQCHLAIIHPGAQIAVLLDSLLTRAWSGACQLSCRTSPTNSTITDPANSSSGSGSVEGRGSIWDMVNQGTCFPVANSALRQAVKLGKALAITDCAGYLKTNSKCLDLAALGITQHGSSMLVKSVSKDKQPFMAVYLTMPSCESLVLQKSVRWMAETIQLLQPLISSQLSSSHLAAEWHQLQGWVAATPALDMNPALSEAFESGSSRPSCQSCPDSPAAVSGNSLNTLLCSRIPSNTSSCRSFELINVPLPSSPNFHGNGFGPHDVRELHLEALVKADSAARYLYSGVYRSSQVLVQISCADCPTLSLAAGAQLAACVSHPRIVQVVANFGDVYSLELGQASTVSILEDTAYLRLSDPNHKDGKLSTSVGVDKTGGKPAPVLLSPDDYRERVRQYKNGLPAFNMAVQRTSVAVMEWCNGGNLADALKQGRFKMSAEAAIKERIGLKPQNGSVPALSSILLTVHDIARALCCLHHMSLQHGHLNLRHVMLQACSSDVRGYVAKLSALHHLHDMRCIMPLMAAGAPGAPHPAFTRPMSDPHCAPECIRDGFEPVGGATDVYALGIIIWELYTSTSLSCQAVDNQGQRSDPNFRPQFPIDAPTQLVALATRCWAADPWERPSIDQVLSSLSAIMARGAGPILARNLSWNSQKSRPGRSLLQRARTPSSLRPSPPHSSSLSMNTLSMNTMP